MKTLFSSFVILCFSIIAVQASSNPWDIEKLSIDQIIELADIQFEMDEAKLNLDSEKSLLEFATFLKDNDSVKIELRGHTNNVPPHEYCDKLSENRAHAVKTYLVNNGIAANRITANGYGKRLPIASNDTSKGRESNQRVEVKILSL